MKIWVRQEVYDQATDVAKHLHWSMSQLVEDALVRTHGMEGKPIENIDGTGPRSESDIKKNKEPHGE